VLRLPSYDRWLLLGAALFTVGATVDITWYVRTDGTKTPFWSWIGILGTLCIAVGAVMLAIGFFLRTDKKPEDPALDASASGQAEVRQERIGYRVSGRAKARPHNSHIRNQDVAFDVRDDGEVADTDTHIE
jgi:hypothetical protein